MSTVDGGAAAWVVAMTRRRWPHAWVGALASLVGCIEAPTLPSATWLAPRIVATNRQHPRYSPVVARAALGGEVFVAWRAHADDGGASPSEVWVASRTADGSWRPASRLDVDETWRGLGLEDSLAIGIDRRGRTVVVWRHGSVADSGLRAARYQDGGWTDPVELVGTAGAAVVAACTGPGDGVTLVWGTQSEIFASTHSPDSWSSPELVTRTTQPVRSLVVAADDRAVAAGWVTEEGGFRGYFADRAFAAVRGERGWGPAATLAEAGLISGLHVALHSSGAAVALWSQGASGPYGGLNSVWGAAADAGRDWNAAQRLEGTSGGMAASATGDIVAALATAQGLSFRRFDGEWTSSTRWANGASAIRLPIVAIDRRGHLLAGWESALGRADARELWALSSAAPSDRPFFVNPPAEGRPCDRFISDWDLVTSAVDSGTIVWSDVAECEGRVATIWARSFSP